MKTFMNRLGKLLIGLAILGYGATLIQNAKNDGSAHSTIHSTSTSTSTASSGETYRLVLNGETGGETTFRTGMSQGACKLAKEIARAALNDSERAALDRGNGYLGCQPDSSY